MAAAVPSRMLPDGLELARDAITPEQEARLIEACARCDLAYYEQDPGNPRSRKSFGWEYDIAGDRFSLGDPVPEAFHGVRALAAEFSGVAERDIVDCMVIHYEPGALIQPHYDKPVFDQIVGLSLASDCEMVFSKPAELGGEEISVTLPRRAMFRMTGDARFVFRHAIPPVSHARWSLTFRSLTPAGEALRAAFANVARD